MLETYKIIRSLSWKGVRSDDNTQRRANFRTNQDWEPGGHSSQRKWDKHRTRGSSRKGKVSGSSRSKSSERKFEKLSVERIISDLRCKLQEFGFYKIMRMLQSQEMM